MFKVGVLNFSFNYIDEFVDDFEGEEVEYRITECEVWKKGEDKDKIIIFKANTIYNPQHDPNPYMKFKGRKIVLQRVLNYLTEKCNFTKNDRKLIWEEYFRVSPKSKRS